MEHLFHPVAQCQDSRNKLLIAINFFLKWTALRVWMTLQHRVSLVIGFQGNTETKMNRSTEDNAEVFIMHLKAFHSHLAHPPPTQSLQAHLAGMLNSTTQICVIDGLLSSRLPNPITGFIGCVTTVSRNGKIISSCTTWKPMLKSHKALICCNCVK